MFKRGTVTTSLYILSDRWGWDRKKTRRFLNILEVEEMATTERTTRGTIITIVNYEVYQDYGTTNGTTNGTTVSPTPSPTVSPTPSPILNKEKNIKKGKKNIFVPPTREEVREYVRENDIQVDADDFFDYFSDTNWIDSKGNKVNSWKGKLRTWAKFNTPKPKKQYAIVDGRFSDDLDMIEQLQGRRHTQ